MNHFINTFSHLESTFSHLESTSNHYSKSLEPLYEVVGTPSEQPPTTSLTVSDRSISTFTHLSKGLETVNEHPLATYITGYTPPYSRG
jgi:hypothetical protein